MFEYAKALVYGLLMGLVFWYGVFVILTVISTIAYFYVRILFS